MEAGMMDRASFWAAGALIFFAGLLPAPFASAQGFDHGHKAWDALVKKHVVVLQGGKASQVRYAEFAKDRAALKGYLDSLSKVSEAQFNGWSKPQRMAFLINAYNAFTVEKILTRYPNLKSIRDFGTVFGNPWKDGFFTLFGRESWLDQVEHEMLRKPGAYDELRVHYAVNCASIGCPMLREEAFVADRLEAQLEEQAVRFLSDRSRNRFEAGKLEVSKIFDWFKEDFGVREQYFARYAKLLAQVPEAQKIVAEGRAPLAFLDYDWTLNDVMREVTRDTRK
jgi:hypothetical protein